ncbi:F-box/LRR-repeat protein-like [Iris pallida]|uniref:F-box/LRR-repeat protein-like n=1 Tax=Iris pallida TaxID=29817 RepID=A0AAX6FVC7_IRIPA|nr:F-box/LRR-repeat protein-like [Iris pallida]
MGGSWHRLLGQRILQAGPGGPHAERALRVQALARGVHGRPVLESPQPPGHGSHAMEQLQHEIQASVQHQALLVHGLHEDVIDRGRGSTVELAFSTERFASLQELEYASINCLKLKVLGLPNMFQEEDKHLPGFIEKWKDLEFLTMGRKPSSFLEIIERISLNCSSFRGLCLSGRIDSEDASAIAKHLPKLKRLVMSGCSLGKRELLAILDGCRELQAVDVSNCTGFVPDDEIMRIASFVGEFKHEGAKMEEEYMVYYGDVYWGMDC